MEGKEYAARLLKMRKALQIHDCVWRKSKQEALSSRNPHYKHYQADLQLTIATYHR